MAKVELSPDRKYLYYQALTGRTLYRIPTNSLLNEPDPGKLALAVQEVGQTGAADGESSSAPMDASTLQPSRKMPSPN